MESPNRREVSVLIGTRALEPGGDARWCDGGQELVDSSLVSDALNLAKTWSYFEPVIRLDVDWKSVDVASSDVMSDLRLLEEVRLPAQTSIMVEALPLSAADAEGRVAELLRGLSPEVVRR